MHCKFFDKVQASAPYVTMGQTSVCMRRALRGGLIALLLHRGYSFPILSRARASSLVLISSSHTALELNLAPRYLNEETCEIGLPFIEILADGASSSHTFITSVFSC